MVNHERQLTRHIEETGDVYLAVRAHFGDLEKTEGIFVRPTIVPEIFHLGGKNDETTHDLVRNVIAYDFEKPHELVRAIMEEAIPISGNELLRRSQDPYEEGRIPAGHIDHEQTLSRMRADGRLFGEKNSVEEAVAYLSSLYKSGIMFGNQNLATCLPVEFKYILNDPLSAIDLYSACQKDIKRCGPGWSHIAKRPEIHPGHNYYYLGGQWVNEEAIEEKLKIFYDKGEIHFTDSTCDLCAQNLNMCELEKQYGKRKN